MSTTSPPLSGIRIIAVEQFGAGPFATLFLADLGAEVIKIEDPGSGGDVGRYVPPGQVEGDSLYFESFNRGKRSVALDLKSPAGRQVFERMVKSADVVFNNLRGDQVGRLGLNYEALRHINPKIVCASLSAYGRTGPRSAEPVYDALVQAEAGWAALTGEPGGPPVKSGLSLADYATGLTAALGIVTALFDVERTGVGRDVGTSLYDVALSMLTYPAAWYMSAGIETDRQPMSAHPSLVPFQFFPTADGYIAIACAKEKFFRALADEIGLPNLAEDPRFTSFSARQEHRDGLLSILSDRLREGTTASWVDRLRGKVPCAPVRSLPEALDPDELAGRDMLAEYRHPRFGDVRSVGLPLTLTGFHPSYTAAPRLGSDTEDVLEGLGYTPEDAERLRAEGAFGKNPPTK